MKRGKTFFTRVGVILVLFLLFIVGCQSLPPPTTPSPESTVVSSPPSTDQQRLEQYPDHLDQALEELDVVE